MSKILIDVPYVEGNDVNPDASLKPYVTKGKATFMMIYGSFCPHCMHAIPDVQQFAKNGKYTVVAVQTDGGPTDKQAAQMLSKVNTSPGVPAFLAFNAQGKFVKMHNGGRTMKDFQAFMDSVN